MLGFACTCVASWEGVLTYAGFSIIKIHADVPKLSVLSSDRWRYAFILLGLPCMRCVPAHGIRQFGRDGINVANRRWTVPLGLGVCASSISKGPIILFGVAHSHRVAGIPGKRVLPRRYTHPGHDRPQQR